MIGSSSTARILSFCILATAFPTRLIISFGTIGFGMKSSAPSFNASMTSPWDLEDVMNTAFVSSTPGVILIFARSSVPEMAGMEISRTARSKCSFFNILSASIPFFLQTTSYPAPDKTLSAILSAMDSSSTTRIFLAIKNPPSPNTRYGRYFTTVQVFFKVKIKEISLVRCLMFVVSYRT